MDSAPASSASDERANVAAFMLGRQKLDDNDDDDAEEAAALAEAAAARKERRSAERESGRAVAQLVERAHRGRGVRRRRDWSPRGAVLVGPAVGSLVHWAVRVVGAVAVDRIEPRIDPAASMC